LGFSHGNFQKTVGARKSVCAEIKPDLIKAGRNGNIHVHYGRADLCSASRRVKQFELKLIIAVRRIA
jgi:hypothetical protein